MNRELIKDLTNNTEVDDTLNKTGTAFLKYLYSVLFLICATFGLISHTLVGEIMGASLLGIVILFFTVPLLFISHKYEKRDQS